MPVRGMRVGESPLNGRPGNAALDGRVLQDVMRIVIVSEIQPNDWQVHCQNSQHEPNPDQDLERMLLFVGHTNIAIYAHGRSSKRTFTRSGEFRGSLPIWDFKKKIGRIWSNLVELTRRMATRIGGRNFLKCFFVLLHFLFSIEIN